MKRTDEARKWMAQALPMLVQCTKHMLVSQCKVVTCLIHAFRVWLRYYWYTGDGP